MIIAQIKRMIEEDNFQLSNKVDNLREDGTFSEDDIVQSILNANRIHKRERDELGKSVDGYKYTIIGRDTHGNPFYTAGKVLQDYLGNYYFVITAHQADS